MLQQAFLAHFHPVVMCFGPWKTPKRLDNGPFSDQKWVKKGSKASFFKSHLGPFGMLKQVFFARFRPAVMRLGPWETQKCLENGPFRNQNLVKNG